MCPGLSRLRISGRIRNTLVQWCVLSAGMGSRRCARLEGERHADQPRSRRERCGRHRRRCTCRRLAGNGFDLYAVFVQGIVFFLPQMSLHKVVRKVGVVNLLGGMRCVLCTFLVSRRKTFTQVKWHRIRIKLHQLTSELMWIATGHVLGCGVPTHHVIRREVAP